MTDLYDARARLAAVESRRIAVKNELDNALAALRQVSGEWAGELAGAKEDLPLVVPQPGNVEEWAIAAQAQNLDLLIRRQAAAAAAREVDRLKAGHLPTLDLIARGNRQRTGGQSVWRR